MSILGNVEGTAHDNKNDTAILAMKAAFQEQKKAFNRNPNPGVEEREERIGRLIDMLVSNKDKISDAINSDFGFHPKPASDLIEVMGVLGRAEYTLANLREYMKPSVRDIDPTMLGSAEAYVQYQPKGVVGNIVPWNFPFDLSVGPMIDIFAAGNNVMIKPSEYSPACSELLREMISQSFAPEHAFVCVGGVELSQAFSELPLDHLLYTGSANVARKIMTAAAKNLTPVTLELGGKCPAILTPGSVNAENVKSIIGTKIVKNGQMCVSVDYCFVPRQEIDSFIVQAKNFMRQAAPDYSKSEECTGIISRQHLYRLTGMVEEAEKSNTRIVVLEENPSVDPVSRRMPMYLVIDPSDELEMMKDEIFGPVLPVIPYDSLDDVIARVNQGDRPLGLYAFGSDDEVVRKVIENTISGGAAINSCAIQAALPSLGFGGVGASGMGRHHGIEGFREFSNQRGIFIRGKGDHIDAFFSPYAKAAMLVEQVLSTAAEN